MKECCICGRHNGEEHHVVFRSEQKALIKCPHNKKHLCSDHHRGTYGVHGKNGQALNLKLKLDFQNWLQSVFIENRYYSPGDVQRTLEINVNCTERLLKTVPHKCYLYRGLDIIRACMGGKIYDEQ